MTQSKTKFTKTDAMMVSVQHHLVNGQCYMELLLPQCETETLDMFSVYMDDISVNKNKCKHITNWLSMQAHQSPS